MTGRGGAGHATVGRDATRHGTSARILLLFAEKVNKQRCVFMAMTLSELNDHIDGVVENYKGDIVELSDAIGAARLAHYFGWRVMRIAINSRTYARHQKILGLDFKESLPETTVYSKKSAGYNLVMQVGKFWEAVRGQFSIDPKIKKIIA